MSPARDEHLEGLVQISQRVYKPQTTASPGSVPAASQDSSSPLSPGPLHRSAVAVRAASVHISETWLKESHPVCSSNSGIPVSCSPLGPTWARQVWEGLGGLTGAPRTELLWLSPSQHETGSGRSLWLLPFQGSQCRF